MFSVNNYVIYQATKHLSASKVIEYLVSKEIPSDKYPHANSQNIGAQKPRMRGFVILKREREIFLENLRSRIYHNTIHPHPMKRFTIPYLQYIDKNIE